MAVIRSSRTPGASLTQRVRALAVLALVLVLVVACGEAADDSTGDATADADVTTEAVADEPDAPEELREVLVRAGFYFGSDVEAVFVAQDEGYFAEEGLEVEIREGNGSGAVIQLIGAGGDAEIGWSIDSGTAALNISQGVPVQIAQINSRSSPFGTVCHPEVGFAEPADLVGPTVLVVPGESTAAIFPAYLALNGLDEDDIAILNSDAPAKVQLFASGQADCMIGYDSGDNLQARIANPDIPPSIPWSEHGVAIMGDGVVVAADLVADEPEVVEGFLRAVNRGFADMCSDTDAAVDRFNERFADTYTDADREYVAQTLPMDCESVRGPGGAPFEPVTDDEWDGMVEILAEHGGLDPVLERDAYLLDDLETGEVDW